MFKVDTGSWNRDVAKFLKKAEEAVGENALRSAGYAGAEVLKEAAKANAPIDTGTLKNNIIVKRLEEESEGNKRQTYIVTVRKGKKGGEDAYYWQWVEYGTAKMAARPFLRPAYSWRGEALAAMKKRMAEKFDEAMKK